MGNLWSETCFAFNGSTTWWIRFNASKLKESIIITIIIIHNYPPKNVICCSLWWCYGENNTPADARLLSAEPEPRYRPTFDKWLSTLPSPEATTAVTEERAKTWWRATWLTSSLQAGKAGRALWLGVAGSFSVWTRLHSLLFLWRREIEEEDKKNKKRRKKSCQWRLCAVI